MLTSRQDCRSALFSTMAIFAEEISLQEQRDTLEEICGNDSDDVAFHDDTRVHSVTHASERYRSSEASATLK